MLTQEIFLVFGFPLVVFAATCQSFLRVKYPHVTKKDILLRSSRLLTLILPVILIVLFISKERQVDDLKTHILSRGLISEHWVERGLWTLKEPINHIDNLGAGVSRFDLSHLLKIMPSTIFYFILSLCVFIFGTARTTNRKINSFIILSIASVCFAPLLLLAFAWDFGRIMSFSNFHAFFVFILILHFSDKKTKSIPLNIKIILMVFILLLTSFNLYTADKLPLMFKNADLIFII
jgi:hypothetical protein